MLVRWLLLLALAVAPLGAIQRPDSKTTLRQLTRLPRIEMRLSLDFDAANGFPVLRTNTDPAVLIGRKRSDLAEKPGDPDLLLELASLHNDTGELGTGHIYFRRADEAFRRRLESAPANRDLRLGQASALHGLSRHAEAESIFREAAANSQDPIAQLALARFLDARAWEIAAGTSNWNGRRSYADLCRSSLRQKLPSETIARIQRLFDEAIEAARGATDLKPELAPAWHRLAVCTASREAFERIRKRSADDQQTAPVEMILYSRAALEHLDKAAELDRANPTRQATAALWRALAAAAESSASQKEFLATRAIDFANDSDRTRIEETLARLEHSPQELGTLLLILKNDPRRASEALHRALERNPESEQVWETLAIALSRAKDYFELAVVSEARGIERPTLRNRLLIAKAYEKLGDYDRAEEEVRLALAMNANDFAANVAMANLLMRTDPTGAVLPRARQSIAAAERSLSFNARDWQLVDLALAQSIYYGLADNPDTARQILNAALAVSKDDPEVSAALDAVGR